MSLNLIDQAAQRKRIEELLSNPVESARKIVDLTKQRNELLAALARTRNMIRSNPDAAENCANDAITRVKGESS